MEAGYGLTDVEKMDEDREQNRKSQAAMFSEGVME